MLESYTRHLGRQEIFSSLFTVAQPTSRETTLQNGYTLQGIAVRWDCVTLAPMNESDSPILNSASAALLNLAEQHR